MTVLPTDPDTDLGEDTGDLRSLRRQLVLLTGVISALVAVFLFIVVHLVIEGSATSAVDRVLADRLDAVAASVEASLQEGEPTLVVPDDRLEPGVAVYDDRGVLVAGQVPTALDREFESLSGTPAADSVDVGESYRVRAEPFVAASGASGVVVVAEPLAPYEDDERQALLVSLASGLVMVVVAMSLAAWASRRALAPVAHMARVAEEWSEHDLDRRFDLGPPTNEIRALGHTMDALLDKVARAITAEQRLTAELAHELRSPLTTVLATAELVGMRDDLDTQLREDVTDIQESCRAMARTIEALLDLARSEAAAADGVTCDVRALVATLRRDLVERPGLDVVVEIDVQPGLTVGTSTELAVRILTPVLDNAVRCAHHVRVSAAPQGRTVRIRVHDDGPGVSPEVAGRVFDPGFSTRGSSGLGLALARRVARSVGGDLVLVHDTRGAGATFDLVVPRA